MGRKTLIESSVSEKASCGIIAGRFARFAMRHLNYETQREQDRATGEMIADGFSRQRDMLIKPECPACHACKPMRLPVAAFRPNDTQRTLVSRNKDLTFRIYPAIGGTPDFGAHDQLYYTFMNTRFPGAMKRPEESVLRSFRDASMQDYRVMALYDGNQSLMGGLLYSPVTNGTYAGLFYYDTSPASNPRSLGTYLMQSLINLTRDTLRQEYVYFGLWTDEPSRLSYKSNFRPFELYENGKWVRYANQKDYTRTRMKPAP